MQRYYTGRRPAEYDANTADLLSMLDTVPPPSFDMREGACRGTDPAQFFVVRTEQQRKVKAKYCDACPIKQPCMDYALAYPRVAGIWGGTTEGERQRIRKRMKDEAVHRSVGRPSRVA